MCLLTSRRLDVFIRDREGAQWLVDRLEPGGIVGEMALITGQQRTATVRATEPSSLLQLLKTDFEALAADKADIIIRPAVAEFNYLDFRPAHAIAQAGYRAAMEQMDHILAAYQEGGFRREG